MVAVVSYGTRVWLADLIRAGWEARVVESRPVTSRYRLVLVDDLEEQVREVTRPARVGVLVERDGSGMFVRCGSSEEARYLLEAALAEAEA